MEAFGHEKTTIDARMSGMGKKKKQEPGKSVSFDAFFSTTPTKSSGGSSSQVKDTHADVLAVQATVLNEEQQNISLEEPIDRIDDAGSIPAPPISQQEEVETNEQFLEEPTADIVKDVLDTNEITSNELNVDVATPEPSPLQTKKKEHVYNDGLVYYCRACKRHFKGPIIVNNSPNLNPFYNMKSCPFCGACQVNDTHNETVDKEGTCESSWLHFWHSLSRKNNG